MSGKHKTYTASRFEGVDHGLPSLKATSEHTQIHSSDHHRQELMGQ